METMTIWESLKNQEGECACAPLQDLFEHGPRTRELFDDCRACLNKMREVRDDHRKLCWLGKQILLTAIKAKELYYGKLVQLIEEEHVAIVLHEACPNGGVRQRTTTWEEFEKARWQLATLNCARCGQILLASVMVSTAHEQSN